MKHGLKRIATCALFAALFAGWPSQGLCRKLPVEWGVMAGINVPGYSTDATDAEVKNRMGWQVGLFASIKLGLVSIDPQLFYVHQKFRLHADDDTYRLKARSVDLPVTVSLRPLPLLRLYAGPVVTLSENCRRMGGGRTQQVDRVRSTISYTAGIAVKPLRHLFFDLRYNGQFRRRKHIDLRDGYRLHDLDSYSVALNIGYLF